MVDGTPLLEAKSLGFDRGGAAGPSPSVLAVTSELPWPLDTGGHLRSYHLLHALQQRFDTRLIVPVWPGQQPAVELLRQRGWKVRPVDVDRRRLWRETLRLAGGMLRGQPYVMFRRHCHGAVMKALADEMRQDRPDLLYLDHLDPLAYWNGRPPCEFVVDLHNVYSSLLARTADERRGLTKLFLRREARLLARFEQRAAEHARALFCCSEIDADHFRRLGATAHVVPNGVDCRAYSPMPEGRQENKAPLVLFIGVMSWAPNVAAVRFLAEDVLPRLRARFPDARLRIVGRDPTAEVRKLSRLPGVEVTGAVPGVMPHLEEADLLAVPLQSGGGTRLKILEAFAAGLPVVSTPIGCEGLAVQPGEHLLVAQRDQFAAALIAAMEDAPLRKALAQSARRLAREQYDWQTITARACSVLRETVFA